MCLHGFTDTWAAWKPVLPALAEHHRVFAPTLPGHYGGPPLDAASGLTLERVVDDVERMLVDEGVETAHLVGNSGGGWLALSLAARGRARSVVALSPGGGWAAGSRMDRRIRRFFARGQFLAPRIAPRARHVAARPRLRGLVMRDVVARPRQMAPEAALACLEGSANCTLAAPLLKLWGSGAFPVEVEAAPDCPIRIAWGTHDRLLPAAQCTAGFGVLAGAEWLLIPGAGHVPMHDEPERVAALVLDFTRRLDRAAPPRTARRPAPPRSGRT